MSTIDQFTTSTESMTNYMKDSNYILVQVYNRMVCMILI